MTKVCEFACPSTTYRDCFISRNGVMVINPRFNTSDFNGPSACMMLAFNDGKDIPVERHHGMVDITCVGPDSSRCPLVMGCILVRIKDNRGRRVDVLRIKTDPIETNQ